MHSRVGSIPSLHQRLDTWCRGLRLTQVSGAKGAR